MNDKVLSVMGLDVGSSRVCAVIADVNGHGKIAVRGIGTSITSGIQSGWITDEGELTKSVDRAISRAVSQAGVKPLHVLTNIPAAGMRYIHSAGFVVAKDDSGQITNEDRSSAIQLSKNIVKDIQERIMHVIPISYKVDGRPIDYPIGAYGRNLEVKVSVILGNQATIRILTQILNRLGFQVNGLMADVIASSQVLLALHEQRRGAILIDIGGRFTKVAVIQNQSLISGGIIPLGGETVTSDISQCLNVTLPEAERLKLIYSDVDISRVSPLESIEVTTKDKGRKRIKAVLLAQIVEARISEIFDIVYKKNLIDDANDFPIVLCGGGGQLNGLPQYIEKRFARKVRVGLPDDMAKLLENANYASAYGAIMQGIQTQAIPYKKLPKENLVIKWLSSATAIFSKPEK